MLIQIIDNGAVAASWLIAVFGMIIGFFMVRTLVKIEKKLEEHEKQINNITIIQIKMLSKMGVDDRYYQDLLNEIKPKD